MRYFSIKDYKNIGIVEPAILNIPDNGGLCVILGENNAGKSNVLSALNALGNRTLTKEEGPNYFSYSLNSTERFIPEVAYYSDQDAEEEASEISEGMPVSGWKKYKVIKLPDEEGLFSGKKFAITFNKKTMDSITKYYGIESDEAVKQINDEIEGECPVFGCYIRANGNENTKIGTVCLYFPKIRKIYYCKADNTQNKEVFECYRVAETETFEDGYTQTVAPISATFCFYENTESTTNSKCENAVLLKTYLKNASQNELGDRKKSVATNKNNKKNEGEAPNFFVRLDNGVVEIGSKIPKYDSSLKKVKSFLDAINSLIFKAESKFDIDGYYVKDHYNTLQKYRTEALKRTKSFDFIGLSVASFTGLDSANKYFEKELKITIPQIKDYLNESELLSLSCIENELPKIVVYDNIDIKDKDLAVAPDKIKSNAFFSMFFEKTGSNYEIVQAAYVQHREKNHRCSSSSILSMAEKKINSLIEKNVTKKFNELYYGKDADIRYSFYIRLEEDSVNFVVEKDEYPLSIDEQSVGFRKFFSLFFKFLYQQKIKRGDIVLIDEVETHLSIPVQKEIRTFLKEFGEREDITFIVSTHSNHILDVRHLDEIRIVKNVSDGVGATIVNDFSAIPDDNSDTLADIKRSLGVEALSLLNKNDKVIFVEGITDYNYLTGMYARYRFNKYGENDLGENRLLFLPICGLGKFDRKKFEPKNIKATSTQEKIKESLLKLATSTKDDNAVLLVDGDRAGSAMSGLASDNNGLVVVKINEYSGLNKKKIKNIEDLFDDVIKEKYNVAHKSSMMSAKFKNDVISWKFEPAKEVQENFDALFEYLLMFKSK